MKKRVLMILSIVALMIMASATIALAEDTGFTTPQDGDIVLLGSTVDVTYVMGYTPANNQPCIKITVEDPSGGEPKEYEDFDVYELTASFAADQEGTYKITGTCGQYITMNMGITSTKYRAYSDENERTLNITVLNEEEYQKQTAETTDNADKTDTSTDTSEKTTATKTNAKKVKTVTVNTATVSAKAIDKAVKAKGGSAKYVTKIILGKKVKKISPKAFAKYKKVTVVELKTKKLTKKAVKNSLKNSKVKTVKVKLGSKKANKTYVKKYKKIFTKKNAGKKVTVK